MSKKIPLTQGKHSIVDDDDYLCHCQFKWYAQHVGNKWYAARKGGRSSSKSVIFLHREIMDAPDGMDVDHVNGDGLDNRKANIRLATRSENSSNKGKTSNNTSGFKGVSWHKRKRMWQSRLKINGREIFLGYHRDIESAVRAYDEAAPRYHGEFAKTNFQHKPEKE